jgi:hypothetical protein
VCNASYYKMVCGCEDPTSFLMFILHFHRGRAFERCLFMIEDWGTSIDRGYIAWLAWRWESDRGLNADRAWIGD